MMSLERMRELEPSLSSKSDEEVAEIREALYELAELALDSYFEKKKQES